MKLSPTHSHHNSIFLLVFLILLSVRDFTDNIMFIMTCSERHVWNDMYGMTCMEWHVWTNMFGMTLLEWHVWNDMFRLTCLEWHFFFWVSILFYFQNLHQVLLVALALHCAHSGSIVWPIFRQLHISIDCISARQYIPYESPILGQLLDLISPPKINISEPRFKSYDPWDMANWPAMI